MSDNKDRSKLDLISHILEISTSIANFYKRGIDMDDEMYIRYRVILDNISINNNSSIKDDIISEYVILARKNLKNQFEYCKRFKKEEE